MFVVDVMYGTLSNVHQWPPSDNTTKHDVQSTDLRYSNDYVTMTSCVQTGQGQEVKAPPDDGVLRFTQDQVACVCEVRCHS